MMKNIKLYFIGIIAIMLGFFVSSGEPINAETNNFFVSNENVIIENSETYPFVDNEKDDENVIKSTNSGFNQSESTITIKFTGVGEIGFYYLISSEENWDFINIFVNEVLFVRESGNGDWTYFSWYSEENVENIIVIKYEKDISDSKYDDCCYLKSLSFDETMYAPLLNFMIDGRIMSGDDLIYYNSDNNEGILSFLEVDDGYNIIVELNGSIINGENNEYDLKNSEYYLINNDVKISYSLEGYKKRNFNIIYNEDLKEEMSGIEYRNDDSYLFVISELSGEKVIKSTNNSENTYSSLTLLFNGSGIFSFDYLASGRANHDYFVVRINNEIVGEKSGISSYFESFSYIFYEKDQYEVVLEFFKGDSTYQIGEGCVYLKNFIFEEINYVEVGEIVLNDIVVEDKEGYIIEKEDNKVFINNEVILNNIEFYVNENIVSFNDEENCYLLDKLKDINEIKIIVSKEGFVSRIIEFYFYREKLEDVFGFENDNNYPFVRSVFDGQVVAKSTIEDFGDTSSSIMYRANNDGIVSVEYYVLAYSSDYMSISINDNVVLRETDISGWNVFQTKINSGDIITISFVKDIYSINSESVVYIRNINIEDRNYTSIVGGLIDDTEFNETTDIVYYDCEHDESILVFNGLNNGQTVKVFVNDIEVLSNDGVYNLKNYLKYNNIITIIYYEENHDSLSLSFLYNRLLLPNSSISHNKTNAYILENIDDADLITLNDSFSSFNKETLTFTVNGIGYLNINFKYFTYNNLNIKICANGQCTSINDNYKSGIWNTYRYRFISDEEHLVNVIVEGDCFYNDIDYFYIKNVMFNKDSDLKNLLQGNGTQEEPYDFSFITNFLETYDIVDFSLNIYNNPEEETIFVKNYNHLSFEINGNKIESNTEILEISLNQVGKSILKVSDKKSIIEVSYFNQGIYNSSIVVGYGTIESPYEISSEEQLIDINMNLDACYVLKNDITLTKKWIGIGNSNNPFRGCFDGNNFTIYNLSISDMLSSGMFASAEGAVISDLILEDVTIVNAKYGGALIGEAYNVEITNVKVVNANISGVNEESGVIIGGLVGDSWNTNFYNVEVSGNISVFSEYESAVGGIAGVEGNFYDSISMINVEGSGFVGGIVGYIQSSIVENCIVGGNIRNMNVISSETGIGIVGYGYESELKDVIHRISGTYSSTIGVSTARVYGLGIDSAGISVNFNEESFNFDVLLTEDLSKSLYGFKANINGYVIRFNMEDGTFKYYELFDYENNSISSNNIYIDLDSVKSYENNFSLMEVNGESNFYMEETYLGKDISYYLNVSVDNINDLEHLRYVINYGIPVDFANYSIFGAANLTINLIMKNSLDLSESNYSGLSNSYIYPYKGSIYGGGHTLKLNIDRENSVISGFINYYLSENDESIVSDLILEGVIKAKYIAGFVGAQIGNETLTFNNITNYITIESSIGASLLGYSGSGIIRFNNCSNYASFEYSVFSGETYGTIYYGGINKNFGISNFNERKDINEIFFGKSEVTAEENGILENYYELNVGDHSVNVTINDIVYVSDENGKISFIMDNNNLYIAKIYSELLKEREYYLNMNFRGDLSVPKIITLDENNKYHKNHNEEWILNARVEFYDSTSEVVTVKAELSNEELNGNELFFDNVTLLHNYYIINSKVDLTRYTLAIEEYVKSYDNLVNSGLDNFKVNGIIAKENYEVIKDIYVDENVSEKTLEFYNSYLISTNSLKENLNNWLSSIVNDISLVDSDYYVVYGDEVNPEIRISYLDGSEEEKIIEFDYLLEDIVADKILIKSNSAFISKNGNVEVYNNYLNFTVGFRKRLLKPIITEYAFEYDGHIKELNVNFDICSKFGDVITNLVILYKDSRGVSIEPVNVGEYSVYIDFDVSNREYYDFSEFVIEKLIINPKKIDVIWDGLFISNYDGIDKIKTINAYYFDVNDKRINVAFDIDQMINAGEYVINAIINDDNYILNEDSSSKVYIINKLDLSIKIDNYTISYGDLIPNIEIKTQGLIVNDKADVSYTVSKGNTFYQIDSDLKKGTYLLDVILVNKSTLEINYNIEIVDGSLTILGLRTEVIADTNVIYDYNGSNFEATLANTIVVDDKETEIVNPTYKYIFSKNDTMIEEAIDAGEYSVKIVFEGTDIYDESFIDINLIINKALVTLQIDNKNSFYGDELSLLTYKLYSGIVYNNDNLNVVLKKNEGGYVGKYSITGTYDNDNYMVTFISGEYEIMPRKVVVLIDNKDSDYLQPLEELTYKVEEDCILEGDNLNIHLNKANGINAGEYSISGTYENDQYEVSFVNGIYTINKINIENISFDGVNTIYNGNPVDFGVCSTTLSDGNEADVRYYVNGILITEIINAGEYTVTAVISNDNYNELILNAIVNVNQTETDLGYSSVVSTYEFSPLGIDYSLERVFFEDGRKATISYVVLNNGNIVDKILDVGKYIVVADISDSFGNYKNKVITKTIYVEKKKIQVEYIGDEYIYNGYVQYPAINSSQNYSVSFYGIEEGKAPRDAGIYIMEIQSLNSNYEIVNNTHVFEIKPLEVVYSNFQDSEYVYTGNYINSNIGISNLVLNDTAHLTFSYYLNNSFVYNVKDVGNYTVVVSGIIGENANNYVLGSNNQVNLEVTKKSITVIPYYTTQIYSHSSSLINYRLSERLFNGDQISGSLNRESGDNVGKYEINIGTLSAGSNYDLILSNNIEYYEILPKTIKIQYGDPFFSYDGSDRKLEVNITGGAHVEYIGDTISVGTYLVRVIIDDSNYCLPDDYEDIIVTIGKRNISNQISLLNSNYSYTGEPIIPQIDSNGNAYEIYYFINEEEIETIIYPGIYTIKVVIDTEFDMANFETTIEVKKMFGSIDEVQIEAYYNKIVIEGSTNLEYKINNGEYVLTNTFTNLVSETIYTISVRSKETAVAYASEPIVYSVKTTKDPIFINEKIRILTSSVNEENILLIKEIEKNIENINVKDINNYDFYLEVKVKIESALNGYSNDKEEADKLFEFIEIRTIIILVVIPLSVMLVVKRKFDLV